ncbi:hypothetical protein [Alistipes putredinis]|jgi:hypothetical protein|uniref:hypothetical protein n=1 Tax=Alistipes putredinis TaxID=28117 RepID=UPI003AB6C336
MSPQKVLWLFLQGFTIKYYLCEAERGDFIVNRQAPTLQKKGHGRYLCDTILIRQTES